LGTNTHWCITEKDNPYFEEYSQKGHVFVYILDMDPVPAYKENPVAKLAIDTNPLDPNFKWTYWDVNDLDHQESEAARYYGKRWPAIIAAVKKYIATADYRGGPRPPGQFWLGDVVRLNPKYKATRGRNGSVSDLLREAALGGTSLLHLLNEAMDRNEGVSNELQSILTGGNKGKRAELEKLFLSATGILEPKRVVWSKTGNRIVDGTLSKVGTRSWGWAGNQRRLRLFFEVVKPIDPQDSVRKYGDGPQPLEVGAE